MALTKAKARQMCGGKAPRRVIGTPAQFKPAKPKLKRCNAIRVDPTPMPTGDSDTEPECDVDTVDSGNGAVVVMISAGSRKAVEGLYSVKAAIKKLEALMMEHIECEAKGEPYEERACRATRIAWYKARLQLNKMQNL